MFGIWPGVHSDTRTPQDVVPVTMLLPPAVLHNPSKPLAPPSKKESAWHSTNSGSGPAANPSAGRLCRPAVGRHTSCPDPSGSPHHIARKRMLSGDGPRRTHGRSQSFWPRLKRTFALQKRSGALAQPPASGFVPTPVGPRPQRPRLRAIASTTRLAIPQLSGVTNPKTKKLYPHSSSTHRFPDERTPIEATPLSATSAELGLGLGLGLGLDSFSHSSSHALPFFLPPSFHALSLSPAFTSVWWSA
jgi:hypothetical protein